MKKDIIILLGFIIVLIILISGAIYLAFNDKNGWGWMLFLAFLMLSGFDYKSSWDDNKEDEEN